MESDFEYNAPQFYDFTQPTPNTRKRKLEAPSTPYPAVVRQRVSPPLAEAVFRFQYNTPPRFKDARWRQHKWKPSLTRPQPFSLQTSERAEVRWHPQQQSAEYVPLSVQLSKWLSDTPPRFKRVPDKPEPFQPPQRTIPHPFHLNTDIRAQFHKPTPPPPPPPTNFKATPVNPKILHSVGQSGVHKVEKKQSTVPEEFSFAKREEARQEMKKSLAPKEIAPTQFKAQPILCATPFKPALPHRKIAATPFHLQTEQRGSAYRQALETQLEQEIHGRRIRTQSCNTEGWLTAQNARVNKSLTEIQAFAFRSDDRASQRAAWEAQIKEKEMAKKEWMQQKEKENLARDLQLLKEYRKTLYVKAHPNPFGSGANRSNSSFPTPRHGNTAQMVAPSPAHGFR